MRAAILIVAALPWVASALPSVAPDSSASDQRAPFHFQSSSSDYAAGGDADGWQQHFMPEVDIVEFNDEEGRVEAALRPPPHVIDFSNYTIAEILNATLHRPPPPQDSDGGADAFPRPPWHHRPVHDPAFLPLHRLAWLVNRSAEAQEAVTGKSLTLLAPTDWALTPPSKRHRKCHRADQPDSGADWSDDGPQDRIEPARPVHGGEEIAWTSSEDSVASSKPARPVRRMRPRIGLAGARAVQARPACGSTCGFAGSMPFVAYSSDASSGLEDDSSPLFDVLDEHLDAPQSVVDDRWSRIIGYIFKYHVLPSEYTSHELADKSTVATLLKTNRVRVSPAWAWKPFPHPTIKFNYLSEKVGPTILAKNGVIHLINHPLGPAMGPLNTLFLFPQSFSGLTSDLQKVGLDEVFPSEFSADGALPNELSMDHLVADVVGQSVSKDEQFTVFIPQNWAYHHLNAKILAILHLPFPFAKRILKYILSYHIVPGVTFFSDYVSNSTALAPYLLGVEQVDCAAQSHRCQFVEREGSMMALDNSLSMSEPVAWDPPRAPKMPKVPDFPRPPGRAPSPPEPDHPAPPSPPHKRPHKAPHHVNVAHYELPTLLNATLKVDVVSWRVFGKGPIERKIFVLPANHTHSPDKSYEEEDEVMLMIWPPKKRGPHPVKVLFRDAPVKNGALQVAVEFIRPPIPEHKPNATDVASVEDNKMAEILTQLFE